MSKYEKLTAPGNERPRKRKKPLDHLTQDVLAAERAGMSYGQYKAAHPYTPDENDGPDDEPQMEPGKVVCKCERCGQPFEKARGSRKKYCCDDCRNAHHYAEHVKNAERMRARPGKAAVCRICGAEFVADHQHRVYCGKECYAEGQRRRQKELKEQYRKELGRNGGN